jgi:diguanylate cyclase (GGDEF)-like protein
VPGDLRVGLVGSLFGTLPVFAGGVANTVLVAAVIAARQQTPLFIAWLVLEIAICLTRLVVLVHARHNALTGGRTYTDIYLLLGVAWSGTVGYGVIVSLASGDWVASTLACLSAAAMVGGICFRNFSAPRLAGTMILLSLGPCLPGAVMAGEPLLYVVFAQIPMYMVAMTLAAFKLNRMLIATMRAERENDHRARHDALTGLANRTVLSDAVEARRAAPHATGEMLAVLFLDLDGFKTVNDTYGHAAGDRLLKMVAERLTKMLRKTDVAARLGGDEFVVLADGVTHQEAYEFGQRLIATVSTSYDLGDGVAATIGVSIGIALAPAHGGDLVTLLAAADAALYEAKSNGKSRCCMASATVKASALRRMHGKLAAADANAARTDVAA